MGVYQIPGNNINLNPLEEESLTDFYELMENPGIIEASLIYENHFNFTYSFAPLENAVKDPLFSRINRLYLVLEKDNQQVIGLIGLVNIDWVMRRCELLLIMDAECRRQRMAYEPVKLLLKRGLRDWGLKRVTVRMPLEDTVSSTVVKSFGFKSAGEYRDYIHYKEGDSLDLVLYFLKAEEAHI